MPDKIPTIGGIATTGEAYTKLMYHLDEAENLCYVMAHLENAQGNTGTLLAKGWLGVGELTKAFKTKVRTLAMRKLN